MIVDGWADWAIRHPGIPDKVYSEPNALQGFVCHSMVGTLQGAWSRLFSTDRDGGRYSDYAAVSWHFSNAQDGRLYQHYPLEASVWCSGSRGANVATVAMESEGGFDPYDEPLTGPQSDNCIRLWGDMQSYIPGLRLVPNESLIEHRQAVERWGGGATACASGRYAATWARWANLNDPEEDLVTQAEFEALNSAVVHRFNIAQAANITGVRDAAWRALKAAGLVSGYGTVSRMQELAFGPWEEMEAVWTALADAGILARDGTGVIGG